MKKTFLSVSLALAGLGMCHAQAIPSDAKIEQRIQQHLKTMTLEEKVGQMTQLTSELIIEKGTHKVSADGEALLRKYKIGSILNTMGNSADSAAA